MKRLLRLRDFLVLGALVAFGIYLIVAGDSAEKRYAGIGSVILFGTLLGFAYFSARDEDRAPVLRRTEDPREALELSDSGRDNTWMAAAFAAMAIGYFIFGRSDRTSGWNGLVLPIGIAFFSGMALYALRTREKPTALKLSPDGIDYSDFGVGAISWHDIGGVALGKMGRDEVIILDVVDPHKYQARKAGSSGVGRRRSVPSGFDFTIRAGRFTGDTELLADEIRKRVLAFGGSLPTFDDDDDFDDDKDTE